MGNMMRQIVAPIHDPNRAFTDTFWPVSGQYIGEVVHVNSDCE